MLEVVDERVLEGRVEEGEKWVPHMTAAKRSQATTGKARNRTTREWRTGRIQRRRVSVRGDAQEQRDRGRQGDERRRDEGSSTCWTMWTENSVVS